MATPIASSSRAPAGAPVATQIARDATRGSRREGEGLDIHVGAEGSPCDGLFIRGTILQPSTAPGDRIPLSPDAYPLRPQTHESHLPTPQSSPIYVEEYAAARTGPPESPLTNGSQRSRASVLQFMSRHSHPRPEDQMVSSASFITPESSPVIPRKTSLSRSSSVPAVSPPASSILSSPFTPRPAGQATRNTTTVTTPLFQSHTASPLPSSRASTPSPRLSSPFMDRLSLADRSSSRAQTPSISHTNTNAIPVRVDDVFATAQFPPQTASPLPAPVPQRAVGGEIQRIRLQMAADQAARLHETEARRPDYLVREKRPSPDMEATLNELPEAEDDDVPPGLGVAVSPNKGRRLKLFQETSEESFEQSLLAGGYPGYGVKPSYADPQTPVAKEKTLSERAAQWLQYTTPGRPGSSTAIPEPEVDVAPSEKELRKRKRLAAFEDHPPASEPPMKLHPVEVEGKGRLIMNIPSEDVPSHAESPLRKRGGRRKRRGANQGTPSRKRGRADSAIDEGEGRKPNWLDSAFPWCMRIQERAETARMEQAEKLKWIERFLDRDSDDEDSEDEPLAPPLHSHEDDTPLRRGRGKMVPLQADPHTRSKNGITVLLPSDPADARAALLSKRSVRALAFRRRQERDITESLEGETLCVCRGHDDGRPLVQCDGCDTWYHIECIGIDDIKELGDADDPWYCPDCLGIPMSSDPVSEPTFVPTDERPTRDPSRDPLFYQASFQESPNVLGSSGQPRTPLRGQPHTYSSQSPWGGSNRAGPSTPLSSEPRVQVYTTPGVFDHTRQDESHYDPTTTPSRGIKFGAPTITPKNGLWATRPGAQGHSPTRNGRDAWGRSGGGFAFPTLGDSGGPPFSPFRSIYSHDDTPVRRAWPHDEQQTLPGRKLWDSPVSTRNAPALPNTLQGSPSMTARSHTRPDTTRERRGDYAVPKDDVRMR